MLALKKKLPEKTKPIGSNTPPPESLVWADVLGSKNQPIFYPIFADGTSLKSNLDLSEMAFGGNSLI